MSKNKTVTTVDGTPAPRSKCRYIAGNFYTIGDINKENSGQCYKIDGKYRREETGYIKFNHSVGHYVRSSDPLTYGVVNINDDNEITLGYFTTPQYILKIRGTSFTYPLMSEEVLSNNKKFRYCISRDEYVDIDLLPSRAFTKLMPLSSGYKNSLTYDCKDIIKDYIKDYNENELEISPFSEQIAGLIKGLSFGLEFETIGGVVPERKYKPLGLIPLRDGSISGLEYATIPYEGAKGIQATLESCKALETHTKYNNDCSLHLHIGNVPRTESFILALFKLLCLVQDDIFALFPLYKKYNFGVKRKNYTKPLSAASILAKVDAEITSDNLKTNFEMLFDILSSGYSYSDDYGSDLDNVHSHPSDPNGNRKWNITSRYHWVNFIPLIFGNKKTVEFRIHTPTTDYNKVISYMLICSSLVNYAKENEAMILGRRDTSYANLSDILFSQLSSSSSILDKVSRYINERRSVTLMQNSNGNIVGNEDDIKAIELTGNDSVTTTRRSRRDTLSDTVDTDVATRMAREYLASVSTRPIVSDPFGIDDEEFDEDDEEDWD